MRSGRFLIPEEGTVKRIHSPLMSATRPGDNLLVSQADTEVGSMVLKYGLSTVPDIFTFNNKNEYRVKGKSVQLL